MTTILAFPPEIEAAIALKSVLDAESRARFLSAVRDCGRDEGQFSAERLQALMAVEEHFQALLLYDQIEFLRRPPPASEADREFATGVQRIFLEAANGFQRFLRHRGDWAAAADLAETTLRVTGLAIHAIHGFMKWGYFLEEPPRPAPWKQLHALYRLAIHEGCALAPFVLHPSQPSYKPTVQSLYLRALALEMLDSGNLSRIQVEIADGWLSSWCADYGLEAQHAPQRHLFYVDLASSAGMRLARGAAQGEAVRYLRADALEAQIAEIRAGLRHGRLHAGNGAGSVLPVEQHVALLAVVERLHQATLAARGTIEERRPSHDHEADVILGLETVLRRIHEAAGRGEAVAPIPASETFEISPAGLVRREPGAEGDIGPPEEGIERWRVQDLSAHGFGLLAERRAAEAALLNGLLGLRNQRTGGWIVGTTVRKLADRVHGETLVGVEVLAHKPIPVELALPGGAALPALFLPGRDADGRQDALLLRSSEYDSANAYVLRAAGAEYGIRLNRIIRKGADWIKARFEIVSKQA